MVGLHFKNGEVIKADRILSFLVGKSIAHVVDQADRWGWRVDLTAEERKWLERAGSDQ